MSTTIFCDKCGSSNRSDARFCLKCGNNLAEMKVESGADFDDGVDRDGSQESISELGTTGELPGSEGSPPDGSFSDFATAAPEGPDRIIIGRYELRELLGRGGMGEVYRAFDQRLEREVAIKSILKRHEGSSRAIERFVSEARTVAKIVHPNIVALYDIHDHEGSHYIAMEYIDGESLSKRIKGAGKLGVDEALQIAMQMCAGLKAAHGRGIVHRDIKPENILITKDGAAKIVDFGIARMQEMPTGTIEGVFIGTPGYASPEQRKGLPDIDARTDIYALGATIYQMLTGSDPSVINMEKVPDEMRRIVLKATEEERENRYPDISDVVDELEKLADMGKNQKIYRDLLEGVLADGLIDASEREYLKVKSKELGISVKLAEILEEEVKSEVEKRGTRVQAEEVSPDIVRCPKCNRQNKKEKKFCVGCGQSLSLSCPACRKEISIADQFCEHCGGNVQRELLAKKEAEKEAEEERKKQREMVRIPAGSFEMGSPEDESGRDRDEGPVHRVTISKDFYMSVKQVTQAQWREVMGENPCKFSDCGDDCPVENVSWFEAVRFCNKLSELEGLSPAYRISGESVMWDKDTDGYRLPTEAEWEYACRAGTTTRFYTGNSNSDLDVAGWYRPNSGSEKYPVRKGSQPHPVGKKVPNAWGLHDMHGNVQEWCWDYSYGEYSSVSVTDPTGPPQGSSRVRRGGSYNEAAKYCRSASRGGNDPGDRYAFIGLRLLRPMNHASEQKFQEGKRKAFGISDNLGEVFEENVQKELLVTEEAEKIAKQERKKLREMVEIPAGRFMMGSPGSEEGRKEVKFINFDDERQHEVVISRPFLVGKYEVTQGQWREVMGTNLSYFKKFGDDCPVENVSWFDAVEFCNKLSERECLSLAYKISGESVTWDKSADGYRLPTEAEWEYACRAGTTTRFYTGESAGDLDSAGWYDGNSGSRTHPVGKKAPNAWGLYDMHGNVWEWCWDLKSEYPSGSVTDPAGPSSGSVRVTRGGCWSYSAESCRSASRREFKPDYSFRDVGLRLLRPINPWPLARSGG